MGIFIGGVSRLSKIPRIDVEMEGRWYGLFLINATRSVVFVAKNGRNWFGLLQFEQLFSALLYDRVDPWTRLVVGGLQVF